MAMRNITHPYKGNYLKHILIVTGVAIPILLIFIFFFVVPFGLEYKHIKRESKLKERDLLVAEHNFKESEKSLKELENLNYDLMNEFKNPKEIDDFIAENPYIEKIREENDLFEDGEIFEKHVYRVETKYLYTTLENFYDLLSNNNQHGMRFVIDFPIIFEEDKKRLKIAFNIALYKLKPIKRDLVRPFKDIQK
jgi:hypothetical protein